MNLLLIQQAYLVKKLQKHQSDYHYLGQLHKVQNQIREWYKRRSQKIKVQSRRKEFQDAESTRIYHHDLHKSFIKKSSILKLETDDGSIIEGHEDCAQYLANKVRDLLENPAVLNLDAQNTLLSEVEEVITAEAIQC